ncbi:response regulator, partial [Bacteroides thetaiotaomicron]|nr:response regulator [Bacteroides thetaiotaomicron]
QAKNQLAQFLIDVILCDIAMPGEDGISLISFAHGLGPVTKFR